MGFPGALHDTVATHTEPVATALVALFDMNIVVLEAEVLNTLQEKREEEELKAEIGGGAGGGARGGTNNGGGRCDTLRGGGGRRESDILLDSLGKSPG